MAWPTTARAGTVIVAAKALDPSVVQPPRQGASGFLRPQLSPPRFARLVVATGPVMSCSFPHSAIGSLSQAQHSA
jgi:hypothetical protein